MDCRSREATRADSDLPSFSVKEFFLCDSWSREMSSEAEKRLRSGSATVAADVWARAWNMSDAPPLPPPPPTGPLPPAGVRMPSPRISVRILLSSTGRFDEEVAKERGGGVGAPLDTSLEERPESGRERVEPTVPSSASRKDSKEPGKR